MRLTYVKKSGSCHEYFSLLHWPMHLLSNFVDVSTAAFCVLTLCATDSALECPDTATVTFRLTRVTGLHLKTRCLLIHSSIWQ